MKNVLNKELFEKKKEKKEDDGGKKPKFGTKEYWAYLKSHKKDKKDDDGDEGSHKHMKGVKKDDKKGGGMKFGSAEWRAKYSKKSKKKNEGLEFDTDDELEIISDVLSPYIGNDDDAGDIAAEIIGALINAGYKIIEE